MADAFPEKSAKKIAAFKKKYGDDRIDVEGRIFGGLDGYKQAINEDVDMVVIATPPGFKPQQFEYAINQGKKFLWKSPLLVMLLVSQGSCFS